MRRNLAQTSVVTHSRCATFAGLWLIATVTVVTPGCADDHGSVGHGAGSLGGASGSVVGGSSAAGSSAGGSGGTVSAAAGGGGALPQCKRADGLDGPDAPRGTCSSKRAYVMCSFPAGVTGLCLTDDPTSCPGDNNFGAAVSCTDQCSANEYGAVCGGVGPNIGAAAPPAGCRSLGQTPGGPAFYCCPCL